MSTAAGHAQAGDKRQRQQPAEHDLGTADTEHDRQRALAGTAVGGDVAQVVRDQDRAGEAAHGDRDGQAGAGHRARLQVRRVRLCVPSQPMFWAVTATLSIVAWATDASAVVDGHTDNSNRPSV